MAALPPKSRKLARRLAALTVEAGENAPTEAKAALGHLLAGRPLAERRAFVNAYLRYLKSEMRASELIVEHAGEVSEASVREIAANFAEHSLRKLAVRTRENPALIAGLRLINGDNVYDASVAGRLGRLASSVH